MEGRNLVSWPAILGTLALVVLGLLAWELRWVLLVLFGAVVLAVALDVPVQVLMRRTPCLLYTSPSPRDGLLSRMPSSA